MREAAICHQLSIMHSNNKIVLRPLLFCIETNPIILEFFPKDAHTFVIDGDIVRSEIPCLGGFFFSEMDMLW